VKLLYCRECRSIKNLNFSRQYCQCRKSSGRYLSDGKHARVNGPCEVLGVANETLEGLLIDSPETVVNKFYRVTRKSQFVERR